MIERLIGAAISQRGAVIFLTLIVAVAGIVAFEDLTIEAFPDPTDTTVNIISTFEGQPAEELERQVSIPIERAVNGMPGLARMRSLNLFGLSFVTLTFRDGVDPYLARSLTME